MEVGNRFMAPAPDPGERLIQTHRESLATATRNRLARGALPIRFECEAARCRIILNAARREIGRLRQGLLTAAEESLVRRRVDRVELAERPADTPPAPHASPPTERMSYAPDPVGKPSVSREVIPPEPGAELPVENYSHVTNLGTLLDVVA